MSDVAPILTARGLMKRYGTVVAMNGADFDLYPGEITAVIGDNGAGKSTLIKAIAGAVIPDHGEITLEGRTVHFKSPQDARKLGIETVYQNLAMSPALSIADNMFLGPRTAQTGDHGQYFSPDGPGRDGKIRPRQTVRTGIDDHPEYQSGGGIFVRWPTPRRGSGAGRCVWVESGDFG